MRRNSGVGAIWRDGKHPMQRPGVAEGGGTLITTIGIEFLEAGDDWLKGRMPVDARTHQPFGLLHGGASVAFAETLASWAATCAVDTDKVCVGHEINANHVRPVRDGWVYGVARPEAIGRTSHVWSIRITDEAGRLVCISRMTLAVIPAHREP
jgi:1,4-dihydroxy-2-naphthoyl-CoA hydrolase